MSSIYKEKIIEGIDNAALENIQRQLSNFIKYLRRTYTKKTQQTIYTKLIRKSEQKNVGTNFIRAIKSTDKSVPTIFS